MRNAFLEAKGMKILLFIAGALVVLLLIGLGFLLFRSSPEDQSRITSPGKTGEEPALKVTDFYLEEELLFLTTPESYPVRDPAAIWNEDEIDRFFIPVEEILHEYFQKTNDIYSKEILSNLE